MHESCHRWGLISLNDELDAGGDFVLAGRLCERRDRHPRVSAGWSVRRRTDGQKQAGLRGVPAGVVWGAAGRNEPMCSLTRWPWRTSFLIFWGEKPA